VNSDFNIEDYNNYGDDSFQKFRRKKGGAKKQKAKGRDKYKDQRKRKELERDNY